MKAILILFILNGASAVPFSDYEECVRARDALKLSLFEMGHPPGSFTATCVVYK